MKHKTIHFFRHARPNNGCDQTFNIIHTNMYVVHPRMLHEMCMRGVDVIAYVNFDYL